MKALSVTQPWATLLACGAKHFETRSYRAQYRGPLAIHASASFPAWARALCAEEPFRSLLDAAGYYGWRGSSSRLPTRRLPRGAIVAVAVLTSCERTEYVAPQLSARERALGDYTEGRWAWGVRVESEVSPPFPYKGMLGLWEPRRFTWPRAEEGAVPWHP